MTYPRAAILTGLNSPLELLKIGWQYPTYGQVLVRVIASGICGAQLAEIRGEKNPEAPLPRPLGHEAVVRVLDVGHGVTQVKEGDKAIAHWRKGDGIESAPATFSLPDTANSDGSVQCLTAGRITTFATHSVISENRLTPVPEDTPDNLCCLLGCSLSTALGTIENEADVKIGESVLIIGCGGLGLNLILAAKLRQAGRIYAMDIHPEKEAMAIAVGATGFINSTVETHSYPGIPESEQGPSENGVRWSSEPSASTLRRYPADKCDVIIDTSGDSDMIGFSLSECLAPSGRFIMVGQPKSWKPITIENPNRLFDGSGKTIIATQGGRFNPSADIPRYVAAWRAGRLNLDGLISHRLPLSEINAGLDLVRQGLAGRVLINCAE